MGPRSMTPRYAEVLPHHYAQKDIDDLFPNIVPPPQDEFGERDLAGRDPALVDPINEPYVIRLHRPHGLTTDKTTTTTTSTTTTDRAVDIDHDHDHSNDNSISMCLYKLSVPCRAPLPCHEPLPRREPVPRPDAPRAADPAYLG